MTLIDDDTLVLVTPTQLKQANVLFIELDKCLMIDSSLTREIELYRQKLDNANQQLIVAENRLETCSSISDEQDGQIDNLNKQIEIKDKKISLLRKTRTLFTTTGTLLGIFGTYYLMSKLQ